MKVTVIEYIEHSAEIALAMVQAYLVRRGASAEHYSDAVCNGKPNPFDAWSFGGAPAHVCICDRDFGDLGGPARVEQIIVRIAGLQGRQPHEVLYDIARGT